MQLVFEKQLGLDVKGSGETVTSETEAWLKLGDRNPHFIRKSEIRDFKICHIFRKFYRMFKKMLYHHFEL